MKTANYETENYSQVVKLIEVGIIGIKKVKKLKVTLISSELHLLNNFTL